MSTGRYEGNAIVMVLQSSHIYPFFISVYKSWRSRFGSRWSPLQHLSGGSPLYGFSGKRSSLNMISSLDNFEVPRFLVESLFLHARSLRRRKSYRKEHGLLFEFFYRNACQSQNASYTTICCQEMFLISDFIPKKPSPSKNQKEFLFLHFERKGSH